MTAEPVEPVAGTSPAPRTGAFEMIHLGEQTAVVVPLADFLRMRALEELATDEALVDAEAKVALDEWRRREAAGQTRYIPADEARRRLGL
jgi:hypothetical protein